MKYHVTIKTTYGGCYLFNYNSIRSLLDSINLYFVASSILEFQLVSNDVVLLDYSYGVNHFACKYYLYITRNNRIRINKF